MFEQELELEKKSSSIVPLLLIVTLIIAIVGVSFYFVVESRRVLTTAEATPMLQSILDNQGPSTVRFETGIIKSSVGEKPHDPHYRLLEKTGFLKVGKDKDYKTPVSLTPQGQAFLAEIPGVKKSKDKDGNDQYIVPLAQRKLLQIDKITMHSPSRATVEYTWQWNTTKAGELFDAAGPTVKAFNTWDRSTLIDKYGAAFYHAAPAKVAIALIKNDKSGWQPATE
jgi:hypothetical protein